MTGAESHAQSPGTPPLPWMQRRSRVPASFFSDHYTMAAERNVHSEGAADGSALGTNAIAQSADEDLESILF